MFLNLVGRVENMKLAHSSPLSPLFETIVNSIQAIESRGRAGRIDIHVERERVGHLAFDAKSAAQDPVSGFRVTDNGVGFTSENMISFETSDSRHKAALGGKGVGRFLWLKAFREVEVDSTYQDGEKWLKRTFTFSLQGEGITPPSGGEVIPAEKKEPITVVTLKRFHEPYKKHCPKLLRTIADRIIDHCLSYFLSTDCPRLAISDDTEHLDLNQTFEESADTKHIVREQVTVRGSIFNLVHVRRRSLTEGHRIHLCANRREVTTENLGNYLHGLPRQFADEAGTAFAWSTFVYGAALDERVDSERGSFSIPKEDIKGPDFFEELSMAALLDAVARTAERCLEAFLTPVREQTAERVRTYAQSNPQYNHVLKHRPAVVEHIGPDATDEKIDLVLHKAAFEIERDVKNTFNALFKQAVKTAEEFTARRIELEHHLNDIGKGKLAQYVLHRKLMLELLDSTIAIQEGEKYALEESVHEIVFPLKTTSAEVPYDQQNQNLWIIDEKLTYHSYLASDRPIKTAPVAGSTSGDRPDLLIFNPAHAFVAGELPFGSIVIVEFKRPGRADYADKDNPITQVYKYISEIKKGTATDRDGRPISIQQAIPFYCYIVSDLTSKMREFALHASLTPAPDGMGFFGFNSNLGAYVEVISYNKLLADAKKRNRVLFEKLSLPAG